MKWKNSTARVAIVVCAAAVFAAGARSGAEQAGGAPQGQPGQTPPGGAGGFGGRGGGRGGAAATGLFTTADANKDGALTREELKTAFDKWYTDWDSSRSDALTQEQLLAGLAAVLPQPAPAAGRGVQNQVPNDADVQAMMAALPDKAPAQPRQPRKVLVLAKAAGFVHSSIPLAAKTVEALGNKTGAWSTTITYDAAAITPENLKQYDALFLDSTTGNFLDDSTDAAATAARKKALLDFVRGGKGLAGIHAATDSYHAAEGSAPAAGAAPAAAPPAGRGGPGAILAAPLMSQGDKNADKKLSRAEFTAVADAWFDTLDTGKSGRLSQQEFAQRFASVLPAPAPRGAGPAAAPAVEQVGTWPEFNKMIGGFFKFHWNDPQLITVKIDDPKSPLTTMFHGQPFEIHDETYTFAQDSWSRTNVHVLTSIDYSKMSDEDKAKEPAGTKRRDGDYGLSWIRREGNGRVFYEAHGHSERVYAIKPMLEHLLAGIQYAIGDLKADDAPSAKGGTR